MNALTEVYGGFKSLLIGMRVTIGQFFKPVVTVQYPHKTLKMPLRYRGHIELVGNPASGRPLCFVCKLCERACPSDCISVDGVKLEGEKRRSVTSYKLNFTTCSLCGACVEVCREGAIRFSRDYNLAGLTKEEFVLDLVQRFQAQQAKAKPEAHESHESHESKQAEAAQAAEAKPAGQLAGAAKSGDSAA
ncbi:MAG TPA: NADH-quinone oxidoreductase subunit I [Dongiaceae bacterium]|nr:NADH-quinone oxidoreductase subunit I [Dongiaceae bacterium]